MTLDELERMAREEIETCELHGSIGNEETLARALLAVLPVVRAAEQWRDTRPPSTMASGASDAERRNDMGVDYTAFVCWGQRIKAKRGLADYLENHGDVLERHRVAYAEYGDRQYGGDGGYILMAEDTYIEIDMRREACAKPLPKDRDWCQVGAVHRIQEVVHELRAYGADIETEGDHGWLVCGHVC